MDESKSKKIIGRFFLIFFGMIGIGILFFIFNSVYNAYDSSIGGINETEEVKLSIDCNQLYYSLSFPNEENIRFKNKMLSSDDILEINFIDVESGETWKKEFNILRPNMEREILVREIPFELDVFQVMPYDCKNIVKECEFETKVCRDI